MRDGAAAAQGRYIHGYGAREADRLAAQSAYWRDELILPGLAARSGESLLEIGCATGATLAEIGRAVPGLRLAGIDLEPEQLDRARDHLARAGLAADLRAGDARALPWPDAAFDHVSCMWLLEHVPDPEPFVREARRVLRPGGTATFVETDYTSFRVSPRSPELDALFRAQRDLFALHGSAEIGRVLGALLVDAGFERVRSEPAGFHFFRGQPGDALRAHAQYVLGFLEPQIEAMCADLGSDPDALRAGLRALRALPDRPGAALTQIVYRAVGFA